eukprot:15215482-Alexandrium_andersonii.AAC.1
MPSSRARQHCGGHREGRSASSEGGILPLLAGTLARLALVLLLLPPLPLGGRPLTAPPALAAGVPIGLPALTGPSEPVGWHGCCCRAGQLTTVMACQPYSRSKQFSLTLRLPTPPRERL